MSKVIDLVGRKKLKKDLSRTDKLECLQALLRCSHCSMRCAKCGARGEPTHHINHPGTGASFRLCADCLDEYTDLMNYLEAADRYDGPSWHNREWVRQWLAWLDYQFSLSNYVSSPEVLAVLAEIQDE